MWMVQGYNEGGGEFNMTPPDYPFNGRKLRPLMPRPNNNNTNNTSTTTTPSLNNHIRGMTAANDHFFSQYHNLQAAVGDQSKRTELNNTAAAAVVVSSRWNPTPEQLRALEELYRRGTRTPSAEQIQQITAQLRRFGKIEGKNVFYWFQNHKARERQKRRRQMESAAADDAFDSTTTTTTNLVEKKDLLGASRTTVFEIENTKNWIPSSSTNSTTTLPLLQESVSIERGSAKAADTDGWPQFDEHRRNFMERNATWPPPTTTHLINNKQHHPFPPNSTTTMPTTTTTTTATKLHHHHHHDLSLFISPHTQNVGFIHLTTNNTHHQHQDDQTLQLFPIRNAHDHPNIINNDQHKETELSSSPINAPNHFIEFLPLKN